MQEVSAAPSTAVQMEGITKIYGSNRANDGVNFDVRHSEIHALLGENGAGKSTLMSILYGLTQPDAGEIRVESEQVTMSTPNDAIAKGIGMVHQNFMLIPTFTVAQNIVLGTHGRKIFRSDKRAEELVAECSNRYEIDVDPRATVGDLPVDIMQRVEILKLLYRGAKTLILDEPTSVLGPVESASLFKILKNLREEGASIVIVTHKLAEVMDLADRVTVLRAGKKILTQERGQFDMDSLADAMVPHELSALPLQGGRVADAKPLLQIKELTVRNDAGAVGLDGLSLDVAPGEIVGVAGVAGNGQQEMLRGIMGVRPAVSGEISVDGRRIEHLDTKGRRQAGLGIIPDDREGWAIAPTLTVAENLALTRIGAGELEGRFFINWKKNRKKVKKLIADYEVRPADPDVPIGSLSGGNKQKVVLARELERKPKVILAANVTQGLDIGSAALVHRKLLEARNDGAAVVVVTGDLDELFSITDRLIVLFNGQVAYASRTSEAVYSRVAAAMAGVPEGVEASAL